MESLFRRLTHQALVAHSFPGSVLDLGGDQASAYRKIIEKTARSITTLNLDPGAKPDILADLEQPFPCSSELFDTVLALNVLEHIYAHQAFLKECERVLKPGGVLFVVVPFLFQIHPSPNDFFRYTKTALERLLTEAGFANLKIQEIGSGVMSARYQLLYNFLPSFLTGVLASCAVFEDRLIQFLAGFLRKKYTSDFYPLGYCVRARK